MKKEELNCKIRTVDCVYLFLKGAKSWLTLKKYVTCYFNSSASLGVKVLNWVNTLLFKFQSSIVLKVSDPDFLSILIINPIWLVKIKLNFEDHHQPHYFTFSLKAILIPISIYISSSQPLWICVHIYSSFSVSSSCSLKLCRCFILAHWSVDLEFFMMFLQLFFSTVS